MIDNTLTDPNISVWPTLPLPSDDILCKIHVSVRYAEFSEVAPHQMANPYDDLTMSVSGNLVTVANWIDENILPFYMVLGRCEYKQGEATEQIKRQLLKGGVQEFGNIAYMVNRTIPA